MYDMLCNIFIQENNINIESEENYKKYIDTMEGIFNDRDYEDISDINKLTIGENSESIYFILRHLLQNNNNYSDNIETTATTSKAKGSKCPVCWKINIKPCKRHLS